MGWVEALKNVFQKREEPVAEAREQTKKPYDECLSMNYGWVYNRKNPAERFYYSEKRRFSRYNDGQEIFCYPMTSFPIKARVMDASLGGLRLMSQEMLRLDTDMGIVLYIKGSTAQFLVKVLWESKKQDSFEYGVEFVKQQNNNQEVLQYISFLKG